MCEQGSIHPRITAAKQIHGRRLHAGFPGKQKEMCLGEFILTTSLIVIGAVAIAAGGVPFYQGNPKNINSYATGLYITLSRVNEGDASYSVVKDADGKILLLRGKAKMPNLKTFSITNKGEVVKFK